MRKAYAHLWENWETVRYFNARMTQIRAVNAASLAFQTASNTGRTVLRGSYPWPLTPSVGENPTTSPTSTRRWPRGSSIPAPCGYFIPQSEYTAPRVDPELGNFGSVRLVAPTTASASSRAPAASSCRCASRIAG